MRAIKRNLVLVLLVVLLSGCSALSWVNHHSSGEPINPQRNPQEITATLYFSDDEAQYLKPETRILQQTEESLPLLLVQALIAGPQDTTLYKTLPPETKVLSVEIKDGVAYVNFSQEVATKHWGGSAGESMTVGSVVNTLTELSEITSVQFLVEGKIQESIWGHGITSEPIERMEELISP